MDGREGGPGPTAPRTSGPTAPGTSLSVWASPEGLVVLVAAAVTSWFASLPLVLLPGLVAYALLTWLRWERFRKLRVPDELAPIEPDTSGLEPSLAAHVQRVVHVQKTVLEAIAASEAEVRALLEPSAREVRSLVNATVGLARKQQDLVRHLRTVPESQLESELRRLQGRLEATRDERAREGFQHALRQQQERITIVAELRNRADRIEAQLAAVTATLDTVAAQVARIRSVEAQAASSEGARIASTLEAVAIDVQALAESLEETSGTAFLR